MSTLIAGLFTQSKQAGEAVSSLKEKGYTDNISLISKNDSGDVTSHQIKEDVSKGASVGAVIGGPVGALTGLLAGAVTAAVPGGILLVAGPLALAWGVTGAAVGALGGGLVGALVDSGFPKKKAKLFENRILRGKVLVSITGDEDNTDSIIQSLRTMGAVEIVSIPQAV